uniref:hypothetical protein n=1 Tax=Demequina subtropica TaxID=1638989 RepID=UPI0034E26026
AQWAYNLTVADLHTYYVGTDGDAAVLVHNSSCSIAAHGVPAAPGVYRLRFADGSEYIGKSVNMHRRVHSHARRDWGSSIVSVSHQTMTRDAIHAAERNAIRRADRAGVSLRNVIRYRGGR